MGRLVLRFQCVSRPFLRQRRRISSVQRVRHECNYNEAHNTQCELSVTDPSAVLGRLLAPVCEFSFQRLTSCTPTSRTTTVAALSADPRTQQASNNTQHSLQHLECRCNNPSYAAHTKNSIAAAASKKHQALPRAALPRPREASAAAAAHPSPAEWCGTSSWPAAPPSPPHQGPTPP